MSVSDWSSDVCSSDLCAFKAVSKKYTVYFTIAKSRGDVIFNNLLIEGETFEWKIGRASCRERV